MKNIKLIRKIIY